MTSGFILDIATLDEQKGFSIIKWFLVVTHKINQWFSNVSVHLNH